VAAVLAAVAGFFAGAGVGVWAGAPIAKMEQAQARSAILKG
jgi:hypothetical protein